MGIINFQFQNDALLGNWLWKLHKNPDSHWTETFQLLYGIQDVAQLDSDNNLSFLKSLRRLTSFYSCSIVPHNEVTRLVWCWTQQEQFTSASVYALMHIRDQLHLSTNYLETEGPYQGENFPLAGNTR